MQRNHLLHLVRSQLISRKQIYALLNWDPTLEKISHYSSQQIASKLKIDESLAKNIQNSLYSPNIIQQIENEQKQCHIITIFDSSYPKLLKKIVDAPLVLYCIGDLSLLNKWPIISIIGSRHPSDEAWDKLQLIVPDLIKNNWIIVSGLAKGIDSFAHKMTLNEKGKTIAVLGSGFNYIYPKENRGVFHLIQNRGLVISEYPPETPPRKYQFPERNRIISGLSLATLVVEARKRSGTLITVNQALEQGRDVYALPDSPLLPEAKGCLELIQDGAKLIMSANDILSEWKEFMS